MPHNLGHSMDGLPIILRLARGDQKRRVVVVGGGPVAAGRAGTMVKAGADVVVIAPRVDDAIVALGVTVHRRPYEPGDLAQAMLVVIATDDAAVNQQVTQDAWAAGILVNRADDAEQSDVLVPAMGERGPVSIMVHTDNISAAAAAMIRDELLIALDPDWLRLLNTVAPYRALIRKQFAHDPAQRRQRLRDLASPQAMHTLKQEGRDALRRRSDELAKPPN